MRPVREITAEEENVRFIVDPPFQLIRRDPVEPEAVGTLVLLPFRIIGYEQDCDRSLIARLESVTVYRGKVEDDGWEIGNVGLYPGGALVVSEEELVAMLGVGDGGEQC